MNCGVLLIESNLNDNCLGAQVIFQYNCAICNISFNSRFPVAAKLCGDCYAKVREN